MTRRLNFLFPLILLFAACGDSTGEGEEDAGGEVDSCDVRISPGADIQTTVQTLLIETPANSTLCFEAGTFEFTDTLTLSTAGITLTGTDDLTTVFDFSGQNGGGNSIRVQDSADGFTIENLELVNVVGDGIRVDGASDVTFRNLFMHFTAGAVTENAAYAIYPVGCTNVLVEGCEVVGVSDAGIYVGQSDNIIVRNNEVHENVAGIEIENSHDAEVYNNNIYDNAGGILIFNLPGLPIKDGARTRVYDNIVDNNNHENFATVGTMVSQVPSGTGIMVMAADNTELHGNTITHNDSAGMLLISYNTFQMLIGEGANDDEYDTWLETTWVHDNTFSDNGAAPRSALELVEVVPLEDILWDGFMDPDKDNSDAALSLCIRDNGDATFRNMDVVGGFLEQTTDSGPHDCAHDPLEPVEL
jgi:parallel beta-helix repeat protein